MGRGGLTLASELGELPAAAVTIGEPRLDPADEVASPKRIGILGGTFDPPHIGHLWLATLAVDSMGLDRVLFMPAPRPPHKQPVGLTSVAERLLMTRLAIEGEHHFELSVVELERPGPSYTIDSVEELQRQYGPETQLFLVMAADSLAQVETWREPHRLLERVEWVVGPRPGSEMPDARTAEERFGANAGRIHMLEGPALDVSSSEIRRRVAAGKTIRYLVPRRVEELIVARGLYRRG